MKIIESLSLKWEMLWPNISLVITAKKIVESKEMIMRENSLVKINGMYLKESHDIGHLKSHLEQLTYDGGFGELKKQDMFKGETSLPSHLRSGGLVFL